MEKAIWCVEISFIINQHTAGGDVERSQTMEAKAVMKDSKWRFLGGMLVALSFWIFSTPKTQLSFIFTFQELDQALVPLPGNA